MEKGYNVKKINQHKNGRSLTTDIFLKIVDIKNNINRSRTNYEGYVLSNVMINKNVLRLGWFYIRSAGSGNFFILVILV